MSASDGSADSPQGVELAPWSIRTSVPDNHESPRAAPSPVMSRPPSAAGADASPVEQAPLLRRAIGFGAKQGPSDSRFFTANQSPFAQLISRAQPTTRPVDLDSDDGAPSPPPPAQPDSPVPTPAAIERPQVATLPVAHSPEADDTMGEEDTSMVDELAPETASPGSSAATDGPRTHTPSAVDGEHFAMDVTSADGTPPAGAPASIQVPTAESSLARDQRIAATSNAASKRGRASRKHFNDRFSENTNKFRLSGYVNESGTAGSDATPPAPGNAPEFVVHEFATRPSGPTQHQPPPFQGTMQVQPQPPPRVPVQYQPPYDPNAPQRRTRRPTGTEEYPPRQSPFTYNPASRPPPNYQGPYDPPDSAYEWGSQYPPQGPPPAYAHGQHGGHGPPSGQPSRPNGYHPQAGPGPGSGSSSGPGSQYRHPGDAPSGGGRESNNERESSESNASERGPYRIRVVNVLIKDERSHDVEEEYAEIKAPIAQADELGPNAGYWVDAKAVVAALQAGPGRIDGPAKVYTMRGRFKQVFLRVTEDNVDQAVSANLLTSPRRVLEVTVVPLAPQPKAVAAVSRSRAEQMPISRSPPIPSPTITGPPNSNSSFPYPAPMPRRSMPSSYDAPQAVSPPRKRPAEDDWNVDPRHDYYDEPEDMAPPPPPPSGPQDRSQGGTRGFARPEWEPQPPLPQMNSPGSVKRPRMTVDEVPRQASGAYQRPLPPPGTAPVSRPSAHPSSPPASRPPPPQVLPPRNASGPSSGPPPSDGPPPRARAPQTAAIKRTPCDQAIIDWVQGRVEMDPEFADFKASLSREPSVPEVLRRFQFVAGQIGIYHGTRTPASVRGAPERNIEDWHLMAALGLDPGYGDEATTILGLWRLYGKKGEYTEHPRVVELGTAEFSRARGRSGSEMAEFVQLLAQVDKEWTTAHPEAVLRKPNQLGGGLPMALVAAPPVHEPVGRMNMKTFGSGRPTKPKERI